MSIETHLLKHPVTISYLHHAGFFGETEIYGGFRRLVYNHKWYYFSLEPIQKLHTNEHPWYFYHFEFSIKPSKITTPVEP